MFNTVTPEKAGISSKQVKKFIEHLEGIGLNTHDVVMMRGYDIFCEAYWKPFDKNFLHRQYSQTKSFVGVAIGMLEEEGKLKLTDKIVDYFKEDITVNYGEFLANQTIEDMLTMRTAVNHVSWFTNEERDRVKCYFNKSKEVRPSGTKWEYDSPGSQVLCALVEKLAGKPMLDYMKEKIFNKMGSFKNARILKTPTGVSWGDSALLCTPRDMLSFGKFVMNYGTWKGERLMNEAYLKKATSNVVGNSVSGHDRSYYTGYGYQIWRIKDNAFGFVGMGQQTTICLPEKDLVFVINSDNQGAYYGYSTVIDYLYEDIVENLDKPLAENENDYKQLTDYIDSLQLRCLKGGADKDLINKINGKKYVAVGENPQGIKEFSLTFNGDEGEFYYVNAQGEKRIKFGVGKNVFGKFPQFGYSSEVGGERSTGGFTYECATSLKGQSPSQLLMFVQIIDKYFGNFSVSFGFKKEYVTVSMMKVAEDFLNEYQGDFYAKLAE